MWNTTVATIPYVFSFENLFITSCRADVLPTPS
jgi:hypothetical protein